MKNAKAPIAQQVEIGRGEFAVHLFADPSSA